MGKLHYFIAQIGIKPEDKSDVILQKHCLVYQALLMSCGGIIWGVLSFFFNRQWQSLIPFGYFILSAINLFYFDQTKKFNGVKIFQTVISLLLPFLFQFSLGGFVLSGAVMLWALLSLAVSVTYLSRIQTTIGLVCFVLLTIFSGIFDSTFKQWIDSPQTEELSILFFTINIVVISSIVFWLVQFMYNEKNNAMSQLQEAQEHLIKQEKLAAFGTMATRMAHEIQNPLNFVNNFSVLNKELIDEILSAKNEEQKAEALKLLTENIEKINQHGKRASNIVSQLQEHSNKGTAYEFFESK